MVAHRQQLSNFRFQPGQLFRHHSPYLTARSAALVSSLENLRQLVERKSDRKRPANQTDAVQSVRRIQAVIAFGPLGRRQHAHTFVVAQRVGTDSGQCGQFPGAKGFACCERHVHSMHCGIHSRVKEFFQNSRTGTCRRWLARHAGPACRPAFPGARRSAVPPAGSSVWRLATAAPGWHR